MTLGTHLKSEQGFGTDIGCITDPIYKFGSMPNKGLEQELTRS